MEKLGNDQGRVVLGGGQATYRQVLERAKHDGKGHHDKSGDTQQVSRTLPTAIRAARDPPTPAGKRLPPTRARDQHGKSGGVRDDATFTVYESDGGEGCSGYSSSDEWDTISSVSSDFDTAVVYLNPS